MFNKSKEEKADAIGYKIVEMLRKESLSYKEAFIALAFAEIVLKNERNNMLLGDTK